MFFTFDKSLEESRDRNLPAYAEALKMWRIKIRKYRVIFKVIAFVRSGQIIVSALLPLQKKKYMCSTILTKTFGELFT